MGVAVGVPLSQLSLRAVWELLLDPVDASYGAAVTHLAATTAAGTLTGTGAAGGRQGEAEDKAL